MILRELLYIYVINEVLLKNYFRITPCCSSYNSYIVVLMQGRTKLSEIRISVRHKKPCVFGSWTLD